MSPSRLFERSMLLLLALMSCSGLVAQTSTLSPRVRADVLQREIVSSYAAGNTEEVLAYIEEYHRIASGEVAVPAPILFLEAKLSSASGDVLRAKQAMQGYLNSADARDASYNEAVEMWPQIERAARPLEEAAANAAVEKEELEKAIKGCESYPGEAHLSVLRRCEALVARIPADDPSKARAQAALSSKEAHAPRYIRRHPLGEAYNRGFVRIPAGRLRMASGDSVSVSSFEMSDTVVWGCNCKTIAEVEDYLAYFNRFGGSYSYRLPTEIEWEYGMRAGTTTKYPWGDAFSQAAYTKWFVDDRKEFNKFGLNFRLATLGGPELTVQCSSSIHCDGYILRGGPLGLDGNETGASYQLDARTPFAPSGRLIDFRVVRTER